MDIQKVNMFLQNYANLCQQFGLMVDSFGQNSSLVVSPLYKKRMDDFMKSATNIENYSNENLKKHKNYI